MVNMPTINPNQKLPDILFTFDLPFRDFESYHFAFPLDFDFPVFFLTKENLWTVFKFIVFFSEGASESVYLYNSVGTSFKEFENSPTFISDD